MLLIYLNLLVALLKCLSKERKLKKKNTFNNETLCSCFRGTKNIETTKTTLANHGKRFVIYYFDFKVDNKYSLHLNLGGSKFKSWSQLSELIYIMSLYFE